MVKKVRVTVKKPVTTTQTQEDDSKIIRNSRRLCGVNESEKKPENTTYTQDSKIISNNSINTSENESGSEKKDVVRDTPTCIRCYIKSEKDIQNINAIILRFNVGRTDIVIQRVGYKMIDGKMAEIDIAALHREKYTATAADYISINSFFDAMLSKANIKCEFIDFADCHKNSAGGYFAIDKSSTIGEFITIEKGSVSDELFSYVCDRIGFPTDIISISIPIHNQSGIFITYNTEWVPGKPNDTRKDSKISEQDATNTNDNRVKITVAVHNKSANESFNLIISQFHSAILECVYDYIADEDSKFFRTICMIIDKNETGNRLIDSLGWVNDIVVSEN